MDITTTQDKDLPFVLQIGDQGKDLNENEALPSGFRVGDLCPVCLVGHLAYNGMLNLQCDECSYTLGGCFT
jgi:hypothetical protein